MNPALSPIVSALERAANLIEKGASPGKALRQVAGELVDHAEANLNRPVPPKPYTDELGAPRRKAA